MTMGTKVQIAPDECSVIDSLWRLTIAPAMIRRAANGSVPVAINCLSLVRRLRNRY